MIWRTKYQDIRGVTSRDVTNKKTVTRWEMTLLVESNNNLRPEIQRYESQTDTRTRRWKSNWSSYKERRVDALALRADERRDKLR